MNKMEKYKTLYFAAPTGTIMPDDLQTLVAYEHVSRLSEDISRLAELFSAFEINRVDRGFNIERWKTEAGDADQVGPGEQVNYTNVTSEQLPDIKIPFYKFAELVPFETIHGSGAERALVRTARALMNKIRGKIKADLFKSITEAEGTAGKSAVNLQKACANASDAISKYFIDTSGSKVFFLPSEDVWDYLGEAPISTQTVFGMNYIENFLDMGRAFICPELDAGKIYCTYMENLNVAAISSAGDLAGAVGPDLVYDEMEIIGMFSERAQGRFSRELDMFTGVKFYPEDEKGIIGVEITAQG